METERQFFSPPEVGKLLGVDANKVIGWIRSGELPAINAATTLCGARPRYRVSREALEAFQRRRAVVPSVRPPRRKKGGDLSRFGIGSPATS